MSLVTITRTGEIYMIVKSVIDAKAAIKELKLKKREYALVKKEITQQQKLIRAEYTDQVRRQGSKMRGGGQLGSLVRSIQTYNRNSNRRELADQLAPLEQQKNVVETVIHAIEQEILHLERYILEHS
ncbi:MAG: hypothetical protein MUD14_10570 [Hydrococcus sp. Prado102]|jgi:hypothetical protein|nr:hypothetical protein [Hydrococcus sp. Prado102]